MDQGSQDWWDIRTKAHNGHPPPPTASNCHRILTRKTLKVSESSEKYIDELIGFAMGLLTPEGVEHYISRPVRHGQETEYKARRAYVLDQAQKGKKVNVVQVGFCKTDDERWGCSPDALVNPFYNASGEIIGCEGGIEIICPQPPNHAKFLRHLPAPPAPEKFLQVQMTLIVTGAIYWDRISFCEGTQQAVESGWQEFICVREYPTETTAIVRAALEEFTERYYSALSAFNPGGVRQ
jgi:YqaJ-like viral recombinase domain